MECRNRCAWQILALQSASSIHLYYHRLHFSCYLLLDVSMDISTYLFECFLYQFLLPVSFIIYPLVSISSKPTNENQFISGYCSFKTYSRVFVVVSEIKSCAIEIFFGSLYYIALTEVNFARDQSADLLAKTVSQSDTSILT